MNTWIENNWLSGVTGLIIGMLLIVLENRKLRQWVKEGIMHLFDKTRLLPFRASKRPVPRFVVPGKGVRQWSMRGFDEGLIAEVFAHGGREYLYPTSPRLFRYLQDALPWLKNHPVTEAVAVPGIRCETWYWGEAVLARVYDTAQGGNIHFSSIPRSTEAGLLLSDFYGSPDQPISHKFVRVDEGEPVHLQAGQVFILAQAETLQACFFHPGCVVDDEGTVYELNPTHRIQ